MRDIEYFAVIAQHRHLGRAAEALGLGQPARSLSLRRLEKAAGAKLVQRTTKGVELSNVGCALLSHVQRLKLAHHDLAHEIENIAQGTAGCLRIGTSPAVATRILTDASSMLLKDTPRVTLSIEVAASTDLLLQQLRKGELRRLEQSAGAKLVKRTARGVDTPSRNDRHCRPLPTAAALLPTPD